MNTLNIKDFRRFKYMSEIDNPVYEDIDKGSHNRTFDSFSSREYYGPAKYGSRQSTLSSHYFPYDRQIPPKQFPIPQPKPPQQRTWLLKKSNTRQRNICLLSVFVIIVVCVIVAPFLYFTFGSKLSSSIHSSGPLDSQMVEVEMRVLNKNYDEKLKDKNSNLFKSLKEEIETTLNHLFRSSSLLPDFNKTSVEGFINGSLIVDFRVHLNKAFSDSVAKEKVVAALEQSINNSKISESLTVDPSAIKYFVVKMSPVDISTAMPNDNIEDILDGLTTPSSDTNSSSGSSPQLVTTQSSVGPEQSSSLPLTQPSIVNSPVEETVSWCPWSGWSKCISNNCAVGGHQNRTRQCCNNHIPVPDTETQCESKGGKNVDNKNCTCVEKSGSTKATTRKRFDKYTRAPSRSVFSTITKRKTETSTSNSSSGGYHTFDKWSSWSSWSRCSISPCSNEGIQNRSRFCAGAYGYSKPLPEGNKECEDQGGFPTQTRRCECSKTEPAINVAKIGRLQMHLNTSTKDNFTLHAANNSSIATFSGVTNVPNYNISVLYPPMETLDVFSGRHHTESSSYIENISENWITPFPSLGENSAPTFSSDINLDKWLTTPELASEITLPYDQSPIYSSFLDTFSQSDLILSSFVTPVVFETTSTDYFTQTLNNSIVFSLIGSSMNISSVNKQTVDLSTAFIFNHLKDMASTYELMPNPNSFSHNSTHQSIDETVQSIDRPSNKFAEDSIFKNLSKIIVSVTTNDSKVLNFDANSLPEKPTSSETPFNYIDNDLIMNDSPYQTNADVTNVNVKSDDVLSNTTVDSTLENINEDIESSTESALQSTMSTYFTADNAVTNLILDDIISSPIIDAVTDIVGSILTSAEISVTRTAEGTILSSTDSMTAVVDSIIPSIKLSSVDREASKTTENTALSTEDIALSNTLDRRLSSAEINLMHTVNSSMPTNTDRSSEASTEAIVSSATIHTTMNDNSKTNDSTGLDYENKDESTTGLCSTESCADGEYCVPISSSEFECYGIECLPSEWKCKNGQCIPNDFRCNLLENCYDKSDEENCSCEYQGLYSCTDNTCIRPEYYCDNYFDCPDKSDEIGQCDICPPRTKFMCNNGRCIDKNKQCDQKDDCGDSSDEDQCSRHRQPFGRKITFPRVQG